MIAPLFAQEFCFGKRLRPSVLECCAQLCPRRSFPVQELVAVRYCRGDRNPSAFRDGDHDPFYRLNGPGWIIQLRAVDLNASETITGYVETNAGGSDA